MYRATGLDGKRLHTVAEIAQTAGVHRTTVYDYLNREGLFRAVLSEHLEEGWRRPA
jgi:AcrR family transcriptional regulator